jgi:predicted NBD/HSP70 family sugar kinase
VRAGASRATISAILRNLEDRGLVEQHVDVDERDGSRGLGRPPMRISLAGTAASSIGLEIGRTELHAGMFDVTGELLLETRRAVTGREEASKLIEIGAELVDDLIHGTRGATAYVLGIGVAVAAPVDAHGQVVTGVSLRNWSHVDLAQKLQARTGLHVRIENDANAAALGEHRFGAGRGCTDLLDLRLSPGVGAGLIIGNRLYRGASGIAGELGHLSLASTGSFCSCGNRGCLETLASPLALKNELRDVRPDLRLQDWIELGEQGDRHVCRLLSDAGHAIGTGLAGAINLLNPARVVIGGALAAAGPVLFDAIREGIARHAIAPAAAVGKVVPGELGSRDAILGVAAVQVSHGLDVLVAPTAAA